MSAAALPRKRFTRDEVEQMAGLGLFAGQRLELIDGDLIDKMGQSPPHAGAIQFLLDCLAEVFALRRVRVQAPLEITVADRRYNFPEPDLSVLASARFPAGKRHPRGDETVLVVEVADTTLRGDSTLKRDLYARAGVPEYWVLNVKGKKLVVHRNSKQGKYSSTTVLTARDSISVGGQPIRIAELLP
jgi:Uma2 family endonuclease